MEPNRELVKLQDLFGPHDVVILIELFGIASKLTRGPPFFNPIITLFVHTHGITEFRQPLHCGIYVELKPDLDPLICVQAGSYFLAH